MALFVIKCDNTLSYFIFTFSLKSHMKYALVDNIKSEATKGLSGNCPICESRLIARCGEIKRHHWAHKSTRNCDPWWENETDWHRKWKDYFPKDWQEVIHKAVDGEKHIADVRTPQNLVIEFQHSRIDPEERRSREKFYNDMIWMVDGTRLKRDFPRFLKGMQNLRKTKKPGLYFVDFPYKCFPSTWLNSSAPIIFDFLGTDSVEAPSDLRTILYCLYPQIEDGTRILACISREAFIEEIKKGLMFKKQHKTENESTNRNMSINSMKRGEPTHYYDPRKNRIVKKWRF
tara:strand:- start:29431 stop:30294 length:864 start_codon:yes stop_codon:yes gene_type:complete